MAIANPPVAQQRKDRLHRAQQRNEDARKRAYKFVTPRNSEKGDRDDVRT